MTTDEGEAPTTTTKHPILVVDDESEILFSLRGLLRQEFELHTAQSGAEALDIMRRHVIHVLMTDQRMPEMTGVELLQQARGACPEAVRIVFTGYADIKAVIDAINQGQIYRFLTKPWDPDELLTVLRQACEEHDRVVEQESLLRDLREHLVRGQELLTALSEPGQGLTREAAQARAGDFTQAGQVLLQRLDRVLAPAASQGSA
jgi:DNA-binding NtrC family response regulator